jgi:hypothetical protein
MATPWVRLGLILKAQLKLNFIFIGLKMFGPGASILNSFCREVARSE